MKVSDVISRARTLLNDTDVANYRWSNAELINAINDAQKLIATHRPDSCAADTNMYLASGPTQTLPSGGFRLMDVICNIGGDEDAFQGRAVTLVNRSVVDGFDPSWRSGPRSHTIKHFIYDPNNPRKFDVYPPAEYGAMVRIIYSKHPVEVSETTDDLTITDQYFEHVLNFVMFRAYSKDMEFSSNAQLAGGYAALFTGLLGIKLQKDNAFSPAVNRKGDIPNAAAMQMGGV